MSPCDVVLRKAFEFCECWDFSFSVSPEYTVTSSTNMLDSKRALKVKINYYDVWVGILVCLRVVPSITYGEKTERKEQSSPLKEQNLINKTLVACVGITFGVDLLTQCSQVNEHLNIYAIICMQIK